MKKGGAKKGKSAIGMDRPTGMGKGGGNPTKKSMGGKKKSYICLLALTFASVVGLSACSTLCKVIPGVTCPPPEAAPL